MTRVSFIRFSKFNTNTTYNYKIYTSSFNKWYLTTIEKVDPDKIHSLSLNKPEELFSPTLNEAFVVTAIESYYSSGSIMLLFQVSF